MHSDGQNLVVMSPRGLDVVDVNGRHNPVTNRVITGLQGGYVDFSGFYAVGNDGRHVFKPTVSLQETAFGLSTKLVITVGTSTRSQSYVKRTCIAPF